MYMHVRKYMDMHIIDGQTYECTRSKRNQLI